MEIGEKLENFDWNFNIELFSFILASVHALTSLLRLFISEYHTMYALESSLAFFSLMIMS